MAGQMIGVEGYVESAAAGLLAAINAGAPRAAAMTRFFLRRKPRSDRWWHISPIRTRRDFQPMNANYGLMPDLPARVRGREKKIQMGHRALKQMDRMDRGEFYRTGSPETAVAVG